jgi:adenine-specific DNA-methyltransferase
MAGTDLSASETRMTFYHSRLWAELLTLQRAGGSIDHLSRSIANSRVDLNPHQVDAALFAFRSSLTKGVVLADEVGLGKTIEAGLVLSQRWAERRRRILLIVPAALRKQWQQELASKFFLPSVVMDTRSFKQIVESGSDNPLEQEDHIVITSYQFAASRDQSVLQVPWDLVVIDEAHRLRNAYDPRNKTANRSTKRCELFDAQDQINANCDAMIKDVEARLKHRQAVTDVAMIRREVA